MDKCPSWNSMLSLQIIALLPFPIKSSAAALLHGMCTACCADGRFVMQLETAVVPIAHRNPRQHHDLIKPLVVNVVGCAVDVTELSKASPLPKHKLGGPGLLATTSPIPESTHVWATLAAVIMCLTTLGKPLHSILIQVLVWVGDLIEQSDWLANASSDMLALPNYQGVKRSRHIHPAFKAAVCMDASSSCAASGSSASAVLYQLKKRGNLPFAIKSATGKRWNDNGTGRQLVGIQEAFGASICVSIAADGTRLGGRDTFVSALTDGDSHKSCWGPPQVTSCWCHPPAE